MPFWVIWRSGYLGVAVVGMVERSRESAVRVGERRWSGGFVRVFDGGE